MDKVTPNLWFDGVAEQAAGFYTRLIPDSRINAVRHAQTSNHSVEKGAVLIVEFTLGGRPYTGINGGPMFTFTEAVSLSIDCVDQNEVDHYWSALTANGGEAGQCGWCKDRYGLSWQVVPRRLREMLLSCEDDVADRAMRAMLTMTKINIATLEAAVRGTDQ